MTRDGLLHRRAISVCRDPALHEPMTGDTLAALTLYFGTIAVLAAAAWYFVN